MKAQLNLQQGWRLYAARKSMVEPVFGIIKQAMGIRQFLTCRLEAVEAEWALVCTADNVRRLCALNRGYNGRQRVLLRTKRHPNRLLEQIPGGLPTKLQNAPIFECLTPVPANPAQTRGLCTTGS